MTAFLTQRIKAREQKIEKITRHIRDLQRERRDIEAELRAYKDVLSNGVEDQSAADEPKPEAEEAEATIQAKTTRMSDTWKGILSSLLSKYPNSSHVDEVRKIVKDMGKEMTDESLRSQLSVYTKNGLLERTGTALYLITESGAAILGERLPSNKEEETDFVDTDNIFS